MLSINHKFIFSGSSKGLCSGMQQAVCGARSGKVSEKHQKNINAEGVATSDHTSIEIEGGGGSARLQSQLQPTVKCIDQLRASLTTAPLVLEL